MKKGFLLLITCLVIGVSAHAQTKVGVTAGYLGANLKDGGTYNYTTSETTGEHTSYSSGFYLGLVSSFTLSEKFSLEPQLLYNNFDDKSFLRLPVLLAYEPISKFKIKAGPYVDYLFKSYTGGDANAAIGLQSGLSYDLGSHLFVDTNYSFQFGDSVGKILDSFHLGLGYHF
ncbi:hypothetical protein ACG2LH_07150 [Zhouia sp. PK063]|uniref:hypothetical protein n=1 Tax=Zhouia sp. PK063 TaxID=3373602 RepID=UPI003799686F